MTERTTWSYLVALGLAHGVLDATSGYTLVTMVSTPSWVRLGMVILGYNIIAFGLQPLIGLLVDRFQYFSAFVVGAVGLMLIALLLLPSFPLGAVGILALGSALFHVAAGAQSALLTPKSAVGASFFTAPGVMGLALGTWAGVTRLVSPQLFIFLLILLIGLFLCIRTPKILISPGVQAKPRSLVLAGIVASVLLILGIAFRSVAWTDIGASIASIAIFALLIGVAAAVGKIIGGPLADRFGTRTVTVGMTLLAVCCLVGTSPIWLILEVILFQASTPVLLALLVQRFPRYGATMAGLVLGFGIALGGAVTMILEYFVGNRSMIQGVSLMLAAGLFLMGGVLMSRRRTELEKVEIFR